MFTSDRLPVVVPFTEEVHFHLNCTRKHIQVESSQVLKDKSLSYFIFQRWWWGKSPKENLKWTTHSA